MDGRGAGGGGGNARARSRRRSRRRTRGDALPERADALLAGHGHHRAHHALVLGRTRRRRLQLQPHLRGVDGDGARLGEGGGEGARGEVAHEAVALLRGGGGRHDARSHLRAAIGETAGRPRRTPCATRGGITVRRESAFYCFSHVLVRGGAPSSPPPSSPPPRFSATSATPSLYPATNSFAAFMYAAPRVS